MKKIICVLLLIAVSFLAFGCQSTLEKVSAGLSNYNMQIRYDDENKLLYVTEQLEYKNSTNNSFDNLCFHLYPNAFREGALQKVVSLNSYTQAYPNGESFGNIKIENVYDSKNEDYVFEIIGDDENILRVNLKNRLYPDDKVNINFAFKVQLPNINHRFGYGENAINIANFYPIACVYENGDFMQDTYSPNGDPFYSETSNYSVEITCNEKFVLASSGVVNSEKVSQGEKVTKIEAKAVRDFAFVLSEKFSVVSKKTEKTTINYFYYNDENYEKSLQTAALALQTFSDLYGDYPYEVLNVVKTNFVYGGMEYPNIVYISDSLSSYEDYANVIIHEISHQWWYGVVGNDEYNNSWQDEGLADFSTAVFYKCNPEYLVDYEALMLKGIKTYCFYTQIYSAVYKTLDTTMTRSLDEYTNENEYVYIAYVKGMLLFDSLEKLIGEKDFFNGLKLYYKTYAYKNAKPYDMIWAFEKASCSSLEGFFNSWLDGKVIIASLA